MVRVSLIVMVVRAAGVLLGATLIACGSAADAPATRGPAGVGVPTPRSIAAPPVGLGTASPAPAAAGTPVPRPAPFWVEAPIHGDPTPIEAKVPVTGAVLDGRTARLLRPAAAALTGPRHVGIQVGHLDAEAAPDEFPNLRYQFGASIAGVDEVDVNMDVARRVAALLTARGVIVDLLPATIPPGYLADAFVAIHADGEDFEEASGYKIASGFYRGPHDRALVAALTDAYGAATGMEWSDNITGEMTDYYAFAWFRYEHALAPHTPAAIIELGYLTNAQDREFLVSYPDRAAAGVADGVLRFLDAHPRAMLFAQEIVVPTVAAP